MKQILFILYLIVFSYANSENNISSTLESFYQSGGQKSLKLNNLLKKDIYFQKAIQYLENNEYQISKQINYTDPENPNSKKTTIEQKVPNYIKALDELKKSVDNFNNPVSAFKGLVLIKTVYTKNSELKYFKKFSKLLYENEKNICTAYIDYGDVLANGYYVKKNSNEASKIYEKGLKNKKCTGWYQNILSGRIRAILPR